VYYCIIITNGRIFNKTKKTKIIPLKYTTELMLQCDFKIYSNYHWLINEIVTTNNCRQENPKWIPILHKNFRRDIKIDFANELHEKRRGITFHDENNFDFPSVQTT